MTKQRKRGSAADYFPEAELVRSDISSASAFAGMQPEAEKIIQQNERRVDDISVHQLTGNPFQPRKIFDEERLAELAASIQEHGVLQRIVVRPSPKQENMFEILAGERRWRACLLANQPTCPAEILYNCSDEQMRQVALIENIQRVDLTPLELAETYYELTRENEQGQQLYTIRSLAKMVGKDKSHVEDHLKLLKVPPDTRQLIIDDPRISLRIVAEIGSVPDEADRADLIWEVNRRNENGWNTQDVVRLVKTLKQLQSSPLSSTSAGQRQEPITQSRPGESEQKQTQLKEKPAAVPSPTLQRAKFKLAWDKHNQLIQRIIGKVAEEQPTYDTEQREIVQMHLEKWQSQLQEVMSQLQTSEEQ